jgi:hypothetical protein
MIDIGRIAYQNYIDHLSTCSSLTGFDKWEDIGKLQQDGWRKAAVAVLQYIDKSKDDMDEGLIG